MASGYPNSFYKHLLSAGINFSSGGDTFKVMLLADTYTFDETSRDNDEYIDDISSHEISGTGYSAGGKTIANTDVTQNNTTNRGTITGDDVTWDPSTITARWGAVYKDTGTPGTSPIVRIIDFGSNQSSSNSPFTVSWNALGLADLTAAAA